MKLIIASNNKGKIREYKDIFEPRGFHVRSQGEENICLEVEETGSTFEENAMLKARAVCDKAHCCVISDDSGLEVDALDGEPGVHSARYAGEHGNDEANNDLLLNRMEGRKDRSAAFRCALALKIPGRETVIAEGKCPGTILYERRGTGGFGYDPLFLYEPMGKTYAEMNETEKNQISHRARAAEKMREIMAGLQEIRVQNNLKARKP